MTGRRTGALIGAIAGLVFILINAGSLPDEIALAVRALGVIAFLAVLWLAVLRQPGVPQQAMDSERGPWRVYWTSVAVEVVLIPVGAGVLNRLDQAELVLPWVVLVVGVHFLPLANAFGIPRFRVLAGCLIGLAFVGGALSLTVGAAAGTVVAGVLSGVALLAFAVYLGRSEAPEPA
jgi:hypothetical protein